MFGIRADANSEIGSGHIMRCLAIANALRKQGTNVIFITADRNSEALIKRHGFQILCLNSDWKNPENEMQKLEGLLAARNIDRLLVDSYFVTEEYLRRIRRYAKVIYMDDINKFVYPADILINYNLYADKIIYSEKYGHSGTKLLLGCAFAPLREEFGDKKAKPREKVSDILITTGGSDPYNFAGRLLQLLNNNRQLEAVAFHVVIGGLNPHRQSLEELAVKHDNIILHSLVTKMSKLMTGCDIAVSAGGFTLYELCACAVPAISFSYADNQLSGVKEFHRREIIYYAGDIRDNQEKCLLSIEQRIKRLISDGLLRRELSERTSSLVDGLGVSRIVNEINTI